MKKAILLQAKYNAHANAAMFEVLKSAPDGIFEKEIATYYKSVAKEAEHLLALEIAVFLGNFSNFCAKKVDCAELLQCINADLSLKGEFKTAQKMAELCAKVDAKICEIVEATDDFDAAAELSFPGISFKKSRGFLELAILNHSTHHRGVIAGALDTLGVQNDYNGMLGMAE